MHPYQRRGRRSSFRRAAGLPGVIALVGAASGCALLGGGRGESPESVLARAAADARIRAEIEGRLAAEPSIAPGRIRVAVERGEVELYGSVAGLGALRCAETNAGLTPGVTLIIDHLVLTPGPATVRCLAPRTATPNPRGASAGPP